MTIELPDYLPYIAEPDSTEEKAVAVTLSLRACATVVSDVETWAVTGGVPEGWSGDDADAAGHARTRFAGRTEAIAAALTKATTACDTFAEALGRLEARRERLNSDVVALNDGILALKNTIANATEPDPGWETQAATARTNAANLAGRITTWRTDVDDAQETLARAFQEVDTVAEGQHQSTQDPDVPALLGELRPIADDPEAVYDWWKGLSAAEREALLVTHPELVGSLNGVPTGDRDEANRAQLERDLRLIEGFEERGEDLDGEQERLKEQVEKTQEAIEKGETRTDPSTNEPIDTNLLLYLPGAFSGDGAVAVSYGDPDTADNTAIFVPGTTHSGTSIDSAGGDALDLFFEASKSGESIASIAWIGYDAPSYSPSSLVDKLLEAGDIGNVGLEFLANTGGERLSDFVDGLRATDQGEQSHMTVIGHSYGATTVAHAAADGLDVDAIALIGSPGASENIDHASQFDLPAGADVYVGSADNDPITWLGNETVVGLGNDPAHEDFGATRFHVDPGDEFTGGGIFSEGINDTHSSYFEGESLENLGSIVTDRDEDVQVVEGRDQAGHDYLIDYGVRSGQEFIEDHTYIDEAVEGAGIVIEETGDVLSDVGQGFVDSLESFGGMWR